VAPIGTTGPYGWLNEMTPRVAPGPDDNRALAFNRDDRPQSGSRDIGRAPAASIVMTGRARWVQPDDRPRAVARRIGPARRLQTVTTGLVRAADRTGGGRTTGRGSGGFAGTTGPRGEWAGSGQPGRVQPDDRRAASTGTSRPGRSRRGNGWPRVWRRGVDGPGGRERRAERAAASTGTTVHVGATATTRVDPMNDEVRDPGALRRERNQSGARRSRTSASPAPGSGTSSS